MAKIRCRRCDVCGVEMDRYDPQFRILRCVRPAMKYGVPFLGWKTIDLCDECGTQLQVEISQKIKEGTIKV